MVDSRVTSLHTKPLRAEHFIVLVWDSVSIHTHQLLGLKFQGEITPRMKINEETSAKIYITLKLLKIFYSIYNSAF